MDSTKKLVNDLFAMKMFHCAHCKNVLQIPVMLVENVGNVCHTCYDSIKGEDNLVALENTFVNTILEKVEIPCENESKGCSERIQYEEIQKHKQQCLCQSFHCMAPEECPWTGCLKDFEIHYRERHKSYQLRNQNDHFALGTSLGELRVGVYLLQTSCGDFFLNVSKTDQDVKFVICDIGESINDFEYDFSATFSSEDARKFSYGCKITDWKSSVTAIHAECHNKTKIMTNDKCSNETKISVEYLNCIFQDGIILIGISLNVKSEYISNEECILENFHCKNCQLYLKSKIYSCTDGHNFCGACKNKSRQCCGHNTYRSLGLENVVKKIRVPCTFKDRGCLIKMAANNINHEFSCCYIDLKCYEGCEFTGTPSLLINHLQQKHKETSHGDLITAKTECFISYLIMDNLLFEVRNDNSFPDFIMWTVKIRGNTEQDYYYQIAISFGQIDMTLKAPCKQKMNTVRLTRDMLQEVGYDGSDLCYAIEILKC